MIRVTEVKNKKELKTFLDLARVANEKAHSLKYVQPLNFHMKMMLGKLNTPQKHFFLAYNNEQPVARLGIKVHSHKNEKNLHFGFFECLPEEKETAQALFQHAHNLYPDLKLVGPYHFRMEDPYIGCLIDGFDADPFFLMSYNPKYYGEFIESAGFEKVMDLFTYPLSDQMQLPQALYTSSEKALKAGVTIRTLNKKKLRQEAKIIAHIFNDALSRNWGYEEFQRGQINEMVMLFRFFVDPRIVYIAELNGKPTGCLIMLPDYNPALKGSKGRITLPLIRKFLKIKHHGNRARGYALGVLKEAHGLGIGSLLITNGLKQMPPIGYTVGEISWVLENNGPMNELSNAMSGTYNKIYRIYAKNPIRNQ